MDAGSAGIGQFQSEDNARRTASALELKMRSTLQQQQIEGQQETQRQAAEQAATARTTAEQRGTIEPGLADVGRGALGAPKTGQPMSPAGAAFATGMAPIIASNDRQPSGRVDIVPGMYGIPQSKNFYNIGNRMEHQEPITGYEDKVTEYARTVNYMADLETAKSLYSKLYNGAIGAGLDHLPTVLQSTDRQELNQVLARLAPKTGQTEENVPGGRFSILLAQGMQSSGINTRFDPTVIEDMVNNANLNMYEKINKMGKGVQIPDQLDAKFRTVLPHDQIRQLDGSYTSGEMHGTPSSYHSYHGDLIDNATGHSYGKIGGDMPPVSDSGKQAIIEHISGNLNPADSKAARAAAWDAANKAKP